MSVAALAQLVEQRIRNAWVGCSSHPSGTSFFESKKNTAENRQYFFVFSCFFNLLLKKVFYNKKYVAI